MSTTSKIIGTTAGVLGGGLTGIFLATAITLGTFADTAKDCSVDLVNSKDPETATQECMGSGLQTFFLTAAANLFLPPIGGIGGGIAGYRIASRREKHGPQA